MNLDRRASILGLAAVAGLALFAWWALDSRETPVAPRQIVEAPPPPIPAAPPAVEPAPDNAPATAPATAFGTFRGRVIDAATREPVREFELTFLGTQPTKVGDEAPGARKFRTADGRFEWQYLPPGRWRVMAEAIGYQRFELVDLRLVKGAATSEVLLPLRRGQTLRGRVYDQATNVGIAAARIDFRDAGQGPYDGDWRMRKFATSDKDGSFALNGVPAGRMTLTVSAGEYASRELDVVVADDTAPLEIGLASGGLIAGRLTAADGATPIAGFVGLFRLEQGWSGGTARSGVTGEFSYPHLSPGIYRLTGRGPGGTVTREITLAENERVEGIVLALLAGSTIRGVVRGLQPGELKRLSITAQREGDSTSEANGTASINERGEYELRGVPSGRVYIGAAVNMSRQISRTVDVPANSDVTVDLDFPRGVRLSGRLTQQGRPLARVWLSPRSSTPDDNLHSFGATTSATGEYVMEGLPTGEYFIRIDGYRTRSFKVAGDTVFDIDVPAAQLAGRVLEEDGKVPIVEATVDVRSAESTAEWIRLWDRADHFGRFSVAGLESGAFILTIHKPGYEMYREQIRYSSPIRDLTIRLRRDPGV
ncbi:MAG TPA: carboxypeptidase-like regulatory domain-containing protein, partial [Steroidobacteraceae bacterium]|nr:carboxypeptidase-like regulatory domain-containing protein [Steroidobacteraceae bacterium]